MFTPPEERLSEKDLFALGEYLHSNDNCSPLEFVDGLLHAVVMAPKAIGPSHWMPLVFDAEGHEWQSEKEFRQIYGAIMTLHNIIASYFSPAAIDANDEREYVEYTPLFDFAETYAEADKDFAYSLWAQGFIAGVQLWDSVCHFPFEQYQDIDPFIYLFVRLALTADHKESDPLFQPLVGQERIEHIEVVKVTLIELAKYMAALYQKPQPIRVIKVGRNEPCPCGSGKKYKHCCANTIH